MIVRSHQTKPDGFYSIKKRRRKRYFKATLEITNKIAYNNYVGIGGVRVQIEYSKKATKYINALDKPTKQRIKSGIEKLPTGDIKKLKGIDNGYRLRIGDLRVLFSMENDYIYIDNILPRGQVYNRL